MKKVKMLGLASSLLGLAFLGGCAEEEEVLESLLPAVSVAEVNRVDLDEEIHASGDLEARFHTMIAAEIAGRVTELAVDEGLSVEEGATVLEIDPERRKLDVGAARARRAQARAKFKTQLSQTERIRRLHSENVASEQRIEEAETMLLVSRSDLEAEQAAVGVAARALSDASVSAPFAGMVARRLVQLGEFVQPGTELFEIVSLNPLEAIFSLTELDTERVKMGQPIIVRVGAFPDREFQGRVTFIAPTVDRATRTLRIKAEIDNSDEMLRPGLFARVSLGVSRRENVLMVPEEAVIQRATGAFVFRVDSEDRVARVAIEVGAHKDGWVEVRGEITDGDRVVQRGHGGLAEGMVVAVRETIRSASVQPEVMASGAKTVEVVQ